MNFELSQQPGSYSVVLDLFVYQPHYGASGGSDRQTRERHDTAGASVALFQDARLRREQPTGWTGASHSHYTCTQRGGSV